jgi:prophage tail gpP-like protein
MITLEVNGNRYEDWTNASCEIRLDALSNTFGFTATSRDGQPLPFLGGESCRVYVENQLVLTGHIELVNGNGRANANHVVQLSGRDKTGDLLDSTIGSLGTLTAPITMKQLCEMVISFITSPGDSPSIQVIDQAIPAPFTEREDLMDPQPGQPAFEFLEKYARKRQVLLTSNEYGNLVIAQSSGIQTAAKIVNQRGDPNGLNNVLEYEFSYDQTGRYNLYKALSQLNPVPLSVTGIAKAGSVVEQGDTLDVIDREVRRGRQLTLITEAFMSDKFTQDRATWEANIRKARGKIYSCVLDGHVDSTGAVWEINRLPHVIDEDAKINSRMLINSVTFKMDEEEGSTTALGLVNSKAYTLTLEEPRSDDEGNALF